MKRQISTGDKDCKPVKCVWAGVLIHFSVLSLYQGPPGVTGEQGQPVSTSYHVTETQTKHRGDCIILLRFHREHRGQKESRERAWLRWETLVSFPPGLIWKMVLHECDGVVQGEAVQQLREALKILAERVLILEHMIGVHGEEKNRGGGNCFSRLQNDHVKGVVWRSGELICPLPENIWRSKIPLSTISVKCKATASS